MAEATLSPIESLAVWIYEHGVTGRFKDKDCLWLVFFFCVHMVKGD